MKKWLVMMTAALILSACSAPSKGDIVEDIKQQAEQEAGYKVKATLHVQADKQKQQYHVFVWNDRHTRYRVQLSSEDGSHKQTIIKNSKGIFVMTPSLGKQFKFENNWPQNSSQSYLPESLAADIQADGEAVFKETDKYYEFQTKTRYTNRSALPRQTIAYHKKTLQPAYVHVLDQKGNAVIRVSFQEVNMSPSFQKSDFDETKARIKEAAALAASEQPIYYPSFSAGASLTEEVKSGGRVMLTYEGTKPFTIIEQPAVQSGTVQAGGDFLDMGFAGAELADGSLAWVYNGVSFLIASPSLKPHEMEQIAASMTAEAVK